MARDGTESDPVGEGSLPTAVELSTSQAAEPTRVSGWQRPLVTLLAVLLIAVVGGVAMAVRHGNPPPDSGADRAVGTIPGSETTAAHRDPDSPEKIAMALPAGPVDGRQSMGLPVVVSPQSGLHEGDTVTVIGRGFLPNELVGAVYCGVEAYTEAAGITACQLGAGLSKVAASFDTDANGIAIGRVAIQRFIDTEGYGRIDCQSAPERCMVAVGAADDYDRSGAAGLLFAEAPPFAQPTAEVSPATGLAPGQSVTVSAQKVIAGRYLAVSQCVAERCGGRIVVKISPEGTMTTPFTVYAAVRDQTGEVACEGHCTVEVRDELLDGQSSAPDPPRIPISFDPTAAPVAAPPPSAPARSTTTSPGGNREPTVEPSPPVHTTGPYATGPDSTSPDSTSPSSTSPDSTSPSSTSPGSTVGGEGHEGSFPVATGRPGSVVS